MNRVAIERASIIIAGAANDGHLFKHKQGSIGGFLLLANAILPIINCCIIGIIEQSLDFFVHFDILASPRLVPDTLSRHGQVSKFSSCIARGAATRKTRAPGLQSSALMQGTREEPLPRQQWQQRFGNLPAAPRRALGSELTFVVDPLPSSPSSYSPSLFIFIVFTEVVAPQALAMRPNFETSRGW